MLVDKEYVLFALGLLAQTEPSKALRLMRTYVVPLPPRRSSDGADEEGDKRERSGEYVSV
jgi:hypothetical protein